MSGISIGLPIISADEAEKYIQRGIHFKEEKTSTGSYWVFVEKDGHECQFLSDGRCDAQDIKPIDCACYPLQVVYVDDSFKFFIDTACPAVKHLSNELIEKLKERAIESCKRFEKDTYQHWQNNYVGFIKKSGTELDNFLKESLR
ncbi:MAG: hypothetical protein ABIH52_03705 [Candidatus Aenigmatarchaeota archaeon]|nr:hypothetical protein [Nanoarchaeota archaeon]